MRTRILVIEDNQANLDLMSYLLEAFGYEVMLAKDGVAGLHHARHDGPDLIVCDVHLPKIDGLTVAAELKKDALLKSVPLVAVTAFAMVGDRDKILNAGFDGYIAKPIVPETFVKEISKFLNPEKRVADGEGSPAFTDTPVEPIAPQASKHRKVLIVDDSLTNQDILRSTLEPSGYDVVVSSSVREAIRMAEDDIPDLILSDLNMPGRNGYDLVKTVKAHPQLKQIPFILISSTVQDEEFRRLGISLGACNFIFRPVEPQVLLKQVENCILKGESRAKGEQNGENPRC